MPDLFLSYSRDDSLIMGIIRDNLRKLGFNLWIDIERLEVGTPQWERAVKNAIRTVEGMVVICSPAAEKSEWVNREVHMAKLAGKPIFPVVIAGEDIDAIPAGLVGDQYVDMRVQSGQERGFRDLVASLTRRFQHDTSEFQLEFSSTAPTFVVRIINKTNPIEGEIIEVRPTSAVDDVTTNVGNTLSMEELATIFNFTQDDLNTNRNGRLSKRQKELLWPELKIDALLYFFLAIFLLTLYVLVFVTIQQAAISLLSDSLNTLIRSICLLVAIAPLAGALAMPARLLRTNLVHNAHVLISLSEAKIRGNKVHVKVKDGTVLTLSRSEFLSLWNYTYLLLYYESLTNSHHIVAAEPLIDLNR